MTKKDQNLIWEAYQEITPSQERQYSTLQDIGWEFDYNTKDGVVVMVRNDHGMESTTRLATALIFPNGDVRQLKKGEDVDEVLASLRGA